MKILYYGGQKSGKSRKAERKALELIYDKKPYYIATYDNTYNDKEMQERLYTHQWQREDKFITIEESYDLLSVINNKGTYLIDCISMWILNTLDIELEEILEQIEEIFQQNANIIFVLNDVNSGIIPIENQSRRFVDRTGVIGQKLALLCDEVYEVKLGLTVKLK
jgi:adenosylcobinamide kinase/adenosylcobinamide-phosphate guanylyltransferase